MLISLCANELVCSSECQRFCKNGSDSSLESLIVTPVKSFCGKGDSSRVTIFFNVTRVESEPPKIATRVESLTRVTLSPLYSDVHGVSGS